MSLEKSLQLSFAQVSHTCFNQPVMTHRGGKHMGDHKWLSLILEKRNFNILIAVEMILEIKSGR